jgi:hypothetical protein
MFNESRNSGLFYERKNYPNGTRKEVRWSVGRGTVLFLLALALHGLGTGDWVFQRLQNWKVLTVANAVERLGSRVVPLDKAGIPRQHRGGRLFRTTSSAPQTSPPVTASPHPAARPPSHVPGSTSYHAAQRQR